MSLKTKSVLVHDYGLFIELAVRLARDFGTVYYYCPWEGSYPTPDKATIGLGLPELKRVKNFWEYVDKIDLICFFDVYSGHLQKYLRSKGYRVFGTDVGEILELDRVKFRNVLKENGLPIVPYSIIKGMDNLKLYLKDKKDKWIKISAFRGATETFKWRNWKHSHPILDQVAHKVGEYQKIMEFLVEDHAPGVEVASDWFVMDGKHLPVGIYGYEAKDCGIIEKASTYEKLPEVMREVDDNLEDTYKELGVRGMVAVEMRIDDDKEPYPIDPCMRAGSPPSELGCEMYANFSEIVWNVAEGKMITPKIASKYGAEVLLKSDWAKEDWCAVDFPKSERQWVKFRNLCKIGGQHYYIPQDKGYIIGAAIGLGNSLEEAQGNAIEVAEQVEAEGIYFDTTVFDDLDETLEEAEKILGRF